MFRPAWSWSLSRVQAVGAGNTSVSIGRLSIAWRRRFLADPVPGYTRDFANVGRTQNGRSQAGVAVPPRQQK
jgi:hypothetical protein